MATKRITERVSAPFFGAGADAVDEAAGLIRNVALCGLVSENDRDYPAAVHARDHGKYDGAKVFFDHTDERTGRKFRDWVGVVRAPRAAATGSFGTLELFKSDPNVPKLLEAAKKCPDKFGMSHVAMCKTRRENGRDVVESIDAVESVDIVTDPATVKGLFRHESKGGRAVPTTIKEYVDRLAPRLGAKRLLRAARLTEDDLGGMPMDPAAPPPDDAATDVDGAIDSAFESAGVAVWKSFVAGETDFAAMISKLKELAKAHGNVSDSGAGDAAADTAAEESKKAKLPDPWAVLAECQAERYTPTASQLKALSRMEDAAERREFVRECAAARADRGEQPQSAGRDRTAGLAGKVTKEGKGPEGTARVTWGD
jgi:hypothetical protein